MAERVRHHTTLTDWTKATCGERGLSQENRSFYWEWVTCPHCAAIDRARKERNDTYMVEVARLDTLTGKEAP